MISYSEYVQQANASQAQAYSDARNMSNDLAAAIRQVFKHMRDHRDSGNAALGGSLTDRMLHCQRAYNGVYSPQQLIEIKKFGGSEAYARITAVKCRALTALLEDLYLGAERPWRIEPSPVPELPENIAQSIKTLVMSEVQAAQGATGVAPDAAMILNRMSILHDAALRAAKDKAEREAEKATLKLDDMLIEGCLLYTSDAADDTR